jgi:hypothetical protein
MHRSDINLESAKQSQSRGLYLVVGEKFEFNLTLGERLYNIC